LLHVFLITRTWIAFTKHYEKALDVNEKYQMQNQIPQAINNIENAIFGRFCESKAKNKLCFYFL
jgi:hypothetical protein